jgi:hypothetical protein
MHVKSETKVHDFVEEFTLKTHPAFYGKMHAQQAVSGLLSRAKKVLDDSFKNNKRPWGSAQRNAWEKDKKQYSVLAAKIFSGTNEEVIKNADELLAHIENTFASVSGKAGISAASKVLAEATDPRTAAVRDIYRPAGYVKEYAKEFPDLKTKVQTEARVKLAKLYEEKLDANIRRHVECRGKELMLGTRIQANQIALEECKKQLREIHDKAVTLRWDDDKEFKQAKQRANQTNTCKEEEQVMADYVRRREPYTKLCEESENIRGELGDAEYDIKHYQEKLTVHLQEMTQNPLPPIADPNDAKLAKDLAKLKAKLESKQENPLQVTEQLLRHAARLNHYPGGEAQLDKDLQVICKEVGAKFAVEDWVNVPQSLAYAADGLPGYFSSVVDMRAFATKQAPAAPAAAPAAPRAAAPAVSAAPAARPAANPNP